MAMRLSSLGRAFWQGVPGQTMCLIRLSRRTPLAGMIRAQSFIARKSRVSRIVPVPHRQHLPLWRQPCALLLIALALSVLVYPFAEVNSNGRVLVLLIDQVLVQIAIRAVGHDRGSWTTSLVLGLSGLLAQMYWLFFPGTTSQLVTHGFLLVFYAYAAWVFVAYINYDNVATMDELFACACLYLLFAFLWSHAYTLLLSFDPAALYVNDANNRDGVISYFETLYFSFTTITSVGFGEITPVSAFARSLVILEQLCGVLFLAIVVARLMSMAQKSPRE
jgi:Ion channel